MILDLLSSIIRRIGARLILLDAALPDPMDTISENYPIIILAILVVIALIVHFPASAIFPRRKTAALLTSFSQSGSPWYQNSPVKSRTPMARAVRRQPE